MFAMQQFTFMIIGWDLVILSKDRSLLFFSQHDIVQLLPEAFMPKNDEAITNKISKGKKSVFDLYVIIIMARTGILIYQYHHLDLLFILSNYYKSY